MPTTWHAHAPNFPSQPNSDPTVFHIIAHSNPTYLYPRLTQPSPHAIPHTRTAAKANIDTAHPTVPTSLLTADPVYELGDAPFVLDAETLEPGVEDVEFVAALAPPDYVLG
jgi:hypothetical protein